MTLPISPDGHFYLTAARGERVPHPYRLRWLLPVLLGPSPRRWAALTWASLAALVPLAWGYFAACGLEGGRLALAVALLLVLPGVSRVSLRFPVLLDAPSFALALAAAWAARAGLWPVAVALALVAGGVRETAPLFAALWAWSPWPLVGLVAAGWWRPAAPSEIPWLAHPVREALALRRRVGLDASLYLRPWGAALAGLVAPSWQLAATLAVAHLQLVAAQDSIRLAQWAAPVLVAAAARVIPPAWAALALAVTIVQREERV